MGEEDLVAFALGVDADVVFCVGGMGEEWFNDEVVQGSGYGFDLECGWDEIRIARCKGREAKHKSSRRVDRTRR